MLNLCHSEGHIQAAAGAEMLVPDESVYRIVDAIDEVAEETGRTVPQIALN